MLVPPESLSAVLVMISSKSVSICNRARARRANSGEINCDACSNFVSNMPDGISKGYSNCNGCKTTCMYSVKISKIHISQLFCFMLLKDKVGVNSCYKFQIQESANRNLERSLKNSDFFYTKLTN